MRLFLRARSGRAFQCVKVRARVLCLVAYVVAVGSVPMRAAGAQDDAPFSLSAVIALLHRGADSPRVLQLAMARCVAFGVDVTAERQLRQAGADTSLINGLRQACRQTGLAPLPRKVSPPPGPKVTDADFVLVHAGTFQMGDRERDGEENEQPVHTVTLTHAFYLQKTDVTQAQWETVMGNNPSYFLGCPSCPVEEVSYDDVQQFIAALNARSPGKGYRLPTEAEWEYAARAGTSGDYGVAGEATAGGWVSANSRAETHPVGELQPNAWGLYDMQGNVWEWVSDWYGPYASGAVTDPTGPDSGAFRVLRGGAWRYSATYARSAFRGSTDPTYLSYYYGFRLARSGPGG
jgi:formylglycine-generating enzyme required for sulfatase activity